MAGRRGDEIHMHVPVLYWGGPSQGPLGSARERGEMPDLIFWPLITSLVPKKRVPLLHSTEGNAARTAFTLRQHLVYNCSIFSPEDPEVYLQALT